MWSDIKRILVLSGFSALLACSAMAQRKNAPVNLSAAPVPAPILQGKRAFVSFELGDVSAFPSAYSGGPERAYSEFYQAMGQWGRYQLVPDPKDADIILAIRFVDIPGIRAPQIRLGINDAHGRVSLWGFSEEVNGAFLKHNRDDAFSDAVYRVVADLKLLLSSNGAQATPQPQAQPQP